MKQIKWMLIGGLLVAALGGYGAASKHIVRYNAKTHIINKDAYSFDHTYINLDQDTMAWRIVLQSENLRGYFMKHHRKQFIRQAETQGQSFWQKLKLQSQQAFSKFQKKIKDKATRDTLRKLKARAKKELQQLKQKGKTMLEKAKKQETP